MHLRGVVTSFTENIKDFPTRVFTLAFPVGDAHHDLIAARRTLSLVRRDKDILTQFSIERDEERAATCYLQASDIGRFSTLQDLDDLHTLVFTSAITYEGDGYTVAMQCIGEGAIGEGKGIDLRVIGDEGSTACTVVEASFETLLHATTEDEATRFELLQFASFSHRDERLIDSTLLSHVGLSEGMAYLLIGEDTTFILLKDQPCDALYIALVY